MKNLYLKDLQRLRVQVLYQQTIIVQIAGFLNAVLYAYLIQAFVPPIRLLSWLFAVGLIYLGRYAMHTWFNLVKAKQPFDPSRWENIFSIGVFISGLAWSVAGLFFVPLDNLAECAFLGFLLSGITSAAAAAYSTSMRATLAFLLPAVLPFAFHMLEGGTRFHYSMSSLIILYVLVLASAMFKIHKIVLESIQLRFEKDRLLEELRETQSKIIHSAKMAALGEMAGGVAHEINTPLGILQLLIDTIVKEIRKENIDRSQLVDSTKKLESVIIRISKIVKNLVAFSKQDEENADKTVSVQKLLIETLDFCQSRFQNSGISLEIKPVPEIFYLHGKSSQISQVLLNLINNAFDAVKNKNQPKVVIETIEDKDFILFKIIDNGDGVPLEIREKIMQPFFTTKEIGKGTGLGLSVALGIALAHNGNLFLQPTEEGACFVLSIPKAVNRAVV